MMGKTYNELTSCSDQVPMTTTITIQIDADIAQAFQLSQPEQQQRIQMLINQWMRQALRINSLQNTMDTLSDEAEASGLTPEVLQSILGE